MPLSSRPMANSGEQTILAGRIHHQLLFRRQPQRIHVDPVGLFDRCSCSNRGSSFDSLRFDCRSHLHAVFVLPHAEYIRDGSESWVRHLPNVPVSVRQYYGKHRSHGSDRNDGPDGNDGSHGNDGSPRPPRLSLQRRRPGSDGLGSIGPDRIR